MDNIQVELITVQLTQKQCKQMVMMNFLDSIGFFDAKLARVTIDFDKEGAIGNVSFTHNYKPPKESAIDTFSGNSVR